MRESHGSLIEEIKMKIDDHRIRSTSLNTWFCPPKQCIELALGWPF